jgi:L-2-hydroxyglutarate oxidase LhgO
MSDHIDVLVVGAGVVGLAVARTLASANYDVFVVERHPSAGQETTSRNSGVIHSGIYYASGSLKARLCVEGRQRLYQYCRDRDIAYSQCGKLILAQDSQLDQLESLQKKAIANGVADLQFLSANQVHSFEPSVCCAAGLFSPSTGIVDVHDYITMLEADIQRHNGNLVCRTEVVAARATDNSIKVTIRTDENISDINCSYLINCAGLNAIDLLRRIDGYPKTRLRPAYFAKGNYFVCQGIKPFKHLVYPMPNEAGLGVHATLDLDGTTRFGPDVEWVNELNYSVDEDRSANFYTAIREYWPKLPDGALVPGYAGIRPKLVGPAESAADFVIEGPNVHGVPGLINLLGIESPGLTASLAIAEHVKLMLNA